VQLDANATLSSDAYGPPRALLLRSHLAAAAISTYNPSPSGAVAKW
jgi:hypothetical protein